MASPQESRIKTSFDTLADIIILIKDKPGDVPKTKAKALRWIKKKFPEATDRAICIALDKCCISFKKSKENGRTGLRGLASKRDVGDLWTAIAAMNQMIFHLSEEVETQIGAAPNTIRSSTISKLSEAVAAGCVEFQERTLALVDDGDTKDQDLFRPARMNTLISRNREVKSDD
jgi:hypothetical protein